MKLYGKTQSQVDAERLEQLSDSVRSERDRRIEAIQWRRDRYRDEIELGFEPTEELAPILAYIQALRDVPQQTGFPTNIQWPEVPT